MKYCKVLIILVSIQILILFSVNGQWVKTEHVTFAGVEAFSKVLQNSVFAVQVEGNQKNEDKNDDWIVLGTGFFVRREDNVLLGVTCRHIVLKAKKEKKDIFIGFEHKKYGYIRLKCIVDFIDPEYDVAILRPQKGRYHDIDNIGIESQAVDRELFGDKTHLVAGRGVLIPGYPLGLGVAYDKNHPVFRIGIIAQFTGGHSFLIDGNVSHGNSGSPVFCLQTRRIVGVISSYKPDYIPLFNENGYPAVKLPYNSGLARAISIDIIGEILEKADKEAKKQDTADKK